MKVLCSLRVIAVTWILCGFSTISAQSQQENYNPFFISDKDSQPQNSNRSNRIPGERVCGSSSLSWGGNNYSEVPGIYWAYIRSYCQNGNEITIWTDFTPSLFGSNPEARRQGREVTNTDGAHSRNSDGSHEIMGVVEANVRLSYHFSVDQYGNGTAYINSNEFDLRDGTLFLIATEGANMQVHQVDYNLANISAQDIELLATQHPEITNFFGSFHDQN